MSQDYYKMLRKIHQVGGAKIATDTISINQSFRKNGRMTIPYIVFYFGKGVLEDRGWLPSDHLNIFVNPPANDQSDGTMVMRRIPKNDGGWSLSRVGGKNKTSGEKCIMKVRWVEGMFFPKKLQIFTPFHEEADCVIDIPNEWFGNKPDISKILK